MPVSRLFASIIAVMLLLTGPVFAGPYSDSAHGNPASGVDRSSIDPRYADFARGNCSHCHEQHSSLGGSEPAPSGSPRNPSLRFAPEEELCNACHDGAPAVTNIAQEFLKQYSHPVTDFSLAGRHTLSLDEKNQNGNAFRGQNRHVECSDCHEPHTAQASIHTDTLGPRSANSNAVSGVLLGVWGVEPSSDSRWLPPVNFSEVTPASKEYQICFKCHSYYAFQDADGILPQLGPSGVPITDQAMEFSTQNRSVHPVRVGLDSQIGSALPRALGNSRMKAPWNINSGNQTMYCSDCHGNNTSTPSGPHGSTGRFMLAGGWTWPSKPNGGKLWTLADVKNDLNGWNSKLLCAKCHTLKINNQMNNQPHDIGDHISGAYQDGGIYQAYELSGSIACVACHIPVPHGSSVSRLIGYDSLPEPYKVTVSTGATFPVINQFKKAPDAFSYEEQSCFVPNQAACHGVHSETVPGAEL